MLRRIEPIYQTSIFAQFFHETSNPAPLPFTNSRIDEVSRNIERLSLYFLTQNRNETSPSLFAISREKRDRTRNRNNGEKERKGWLCAGDVLITTDSLPRFIGSFFFFFFFFNGALLPSNGSGHNCVAQLRSTPWREGVHLRATSLPFFFPFFSSSFFFFVSFYSTAFLVRRFSVAVSNQHLD